ncbi:nucleotidyltransferase family protein [Butyricimonas virosa]|uniref:nucleotidyltransferase family protein n=1 Tax=Butyricimonas virosa TaxID=544645 RepID=UPI0024307A47|nr:nucleotidyltransferase family protein [Butyricimonas virosa]
MEFNNHIINHKATILEALNALNNLRNGTSLTLLVLNENSQVIGTLTDGDVRRSLINGKELNATINDIFNKNFTFLKKGAYDVKQIHFAKEKGIELLPVLNEQMQMVDMVNLKKQKSYLPVDAVLMAGGKGERLRPLTEKTPKPLLKVGDKCIIDYNIDRLIDYGIRHLFVTVNYLKEQLEEHFTTPINGIRVRTIREPKFLGTMGSIQFVEDFYNDTILLMNSDLFTNIDYEDFYLHFKEYDADMSIAAVPYTISVPYGIFELDGREIKGMQEKPTYNYYANAGIYLLKRELLDLVPKDTFFNATDFIDLLMKRGYKVIRFPLNGSWIDIGNPQEYQKAIELVKHIK